MTNEEKQLLIKDLCARLPYGVICKTTSVYYDNDDNELGQVQGTLVSIDKCRASFVDYRDNTVFEAYFEHNGQIGFKPYLRPMSSMTEEEFKEYHSMLIDVENSGLMNQGLITKIVDWLDEKMFDHRNLIPEGLALEAPKGMY